MAKILNPAVFYVPLAKAVGKILNEQNIYPEMVDFPDELKDQLGRIVLRKAKKDVSIVFHQQKRAKKYLLNLIFEIFQDQKPGSSLLVITHKRSGGKSIGKRLVTEGLTQDVETLFTGFQGYRLLLLTRPVNLPDPSSFTLEKQIQFNVPKVEAPVTFFTHQELFSSDHLDEGTKAILESVDFTRFKNILDLGCGWGAIGISALLQNKSAKATLVDTDPLALKYTQKNVDNLKLQTRAKVLNSSDLRLLAGSSKFDLLISFPPFHLSNFELKTLLEGTKQYLEKKAQVILCVDKTYKQKFEKLTETVFGLLPQVTQVGGHYLLKIQLK